MVLMQSAGSVLSLDPQSEVYADLDVLKSANYNIALRLGTDDNSSATISPLMHCVAPVVIIMVPMRLIAIIKVKTNLS